MISPTGQPVRLQDAHGKGCYGASRLGGKRHQGADFICDPGQVVVCPLPEAKVERVARPYADGPFSGLLLRTPHLAIKMFYFQPLTGIVGQFVRMGDAIGHAQDIGAKYPGITPHVHLEICSINPVLFINYI